MTLTQQHYAAGPEALVVGLARTGDEQAFAELVRRRQGWVRSLLRRLGGNAALADDLAQGVFVQIWRKLGALRDPERFPGWLRQVTVTTWLQHLRKRDALRHAEVLDAENAQRRDTPAIAVDLDAALATLSDVARVCVVLAYQGGYSHAEIAAQTRLPLGTVKSHVRRGTERLRELLSAYRVTTDEEGAA